MSYAIETETNSHAQPKLLTSMGKFIRPCLQEHPYLLSMDIEGARCSVFKGNKKIFGVELHGCPIVKIQNIDDVVVSYIFKTLVAKSTWEDILLQGGPIGGAFTALGHFYGTVLVVESYECGKALQLATQYSVAVTHFAENVGPVCAALRKRYPKKSIVICGGDFAHSNHVESAESLAAIARKYRTLIASPGNERSYADLYRAMGAQAVSDCIEMAEGPSTASVLPEKNNSCLPSEAAPWSSSVNGETLVADIIESIDRYVSLPNGAAMAVALWVIFSHTVDVARVAPILAILSPVKKCGKTTLLSILLRLVFRAVPSSNLTPAVLFRTIHAYSPTMLIDEADTFIFKSEELNGVLNSGHTRDTAYVQRIGKGNKPERFNTFGPKVIAKIGTLSDTLFDRSIVIQQQRKLKQEIKLKLKTEADVEFAAVRARIARWATDNIDKIAEVDTDFVDLGNDRASDNWEPILAIAKVIGPICYDRAVRSAVILSLSHENASCNSEDLLKHIQSAFESTDKKSFTTAKLISHICADDELPWATFKNGKPISPRELASLLSPFGIKSKNLRLSAKEVVKGYERDQFDEAFSRYVPELPQ